MRGSASQASENGTNLIALEHENSTGLSPRRIRIRVICRHGVTGAPDLLAF